jgi:hypothetical protein
MTSLFAAISPIMWGDTKPKIDSSAVGVILLYKSLADAIRENPDSDYVEITQDEDGDIEITSPKGMEA